MRPLATFLFLPALFLPALLLCLTGLPGISTARAACDAAGIAAEWDDYKARFVATAGRVVDTGNGRISHSEGQGWGMLLAEAVGDRATFDRIWRWTGRMLGREGTALHPWKWVPETDSAVPDPNNASDGDLLIAWALERAGRRWSEPAYTEAARRIATEIRSRLIVRTGGRTVLLPGTVGFRRDDGTIVNLSYYVFPAFAALDRLVPAPEWRRLRQDGLDLVDDARFGRWGLPPDWLRVAGNGRIEPAPEWPARFGYDAIRVPLYLVWGGFGTPERLAAFRAFWRQYKAEKRQPSWTNFNDNAVASYPASAGFAAVAQLVDMLLTGRTADAVMPSLSAADDYYSASLVLLARTAQCEAGNSTTASARRS
jgi:endoglucanase